MSARVAVLAFGFAAVMAGAAVADEVTLLAAAEAGDHETALALLRENPDVDARAPDGTTALMWAAYNEDLDLVKALIARGADCHRRPGRPARVLHAVGISQGPAIAMCMRGPRKAVLRSAGS